MTAIIEETKKETMRTKEDGEITDGKISLWLGVGVMKSTWIATVLRYYLGVRRGETVILKHNFLVNFDEAEQTGSIEKSA